MTEADQGDDARLAEQADIIHLLLPFVPGPEDLALDRICDQVTAAQSEGTPRLLTVVAELGAMVRGGLALLGALLDRMPVPKSGLPATATTTWMHSDPSQDGYHLHLRWNSSELRVQWSAPTDARRPDLLVIERIDGSPLALVALTGGPAGTIALSRQELGVDPTAQQWGIRLLSLQQQP